MEIVKFDFNEIKGGKLGWETKYGRPFWLASREP